MIKVIILNFLMILVCTLLTISILYKYIEKKMKEFVKEIKEINNNFLDIPNFPSDKIDLIMKSFAKDFPKPKNDFLKRNKNEDLDSKKENKEINNNSKER